MAKTSVESQFMYTEHPRKGVIRSKWCLPQIGELSRLLGRKLIYIGLPGIDSLDIKAWLPYLERIVAFQCSEYKEGKTINKIDVKELDRYFDQLEREDKILSGKVYQGFMEDIVIGGVDERGETFSQDQYMKLYNLDFCNNLTTPREVRTTKGKKLYVNKLQVIEELLRHQSKAPEINVNKRFIMYLTVNANIFNGDLGQVQDPIYKKYIAAIKKITNPQIAAVRQLKVYCHSELSQIFARTGFNVEFLPTIFYFGSSYPNKEKGGKEDKHRMLTFTILGTRLIDPETPVKQDVSKFLNERFVYASDKAIHTYIEKTFSENDFTPDPVTVLQETYTYQTLWPVANAPVK